MEGECYAFTWGIMYFMQYVYQTPFLLHTDHKPLEWLANVSNAYGTKGCWIVMLQDFQFKIIHRAGNRHLNVGALSWNPVGSPEEDEDFGSDVMEQKDKLGIAPAFARSTATNEVSINLFTLQPAGQAEDDVKEHHLVGDCGGPNTYSPSKEGLPYVDQMDCRRMVVGVQIMVDATKSK
jgi:hypothetical protein